MSRIFQQLGQAYGSSDVIVTVQVDGNTVYSGTASTVNQPVPSPTPSDDITTAAFTWTDPNEAVGTRQISITATNGTLRLGKTLAQIDSANPDSFNFCYVPEVEGGLADPLTNVTIDGVAKSRLDQPDLNGQWWWDITAGSTLAATLNVNIVMRDSDNPLQGNIG